MERRDVICGGMDTVFEASSSAMTSWLEGYGYLMIMMMSHSLKGS